MTDTPSPLASTPNAVPLARWLLVLATGLLVAWCGPRLKPVLWFGPLFGLLTGAIAIGLHRWFGQPAQRGQTTLAAACATLGCAAVFGLAIQAAHKPNPKDAAAEALLRSMEKSGALPATESSVPDFAWRAALERYVTKRYRQQTGPGGAWLAAEILSAGMIAGGLHGLVNRNRHPVTEAAA